MDAADRRVPLSVLDPVRPVLDVRLPGLAAALLAAACAFEGGTCPEDPHAMAPSSEPPRPSRLRAALAVFGIGKAPASPPPADWRAAWVSAATDFGLPLFCLPRRFLDQHMFEDAVSRNGFALRDVPPEAVAPDLCRRAVAQNGRALKYVPETMRSRAVALEAVRQNGMALALVPVALRDREICVTAVGQNPRALDFVPHGIADHEMFQCAAGTDENVCVSEIFD